MVHSKNNSQLSFLLDFESKQPSASLAHIGDCECLGFRYRVFYECFYGIVMRLKLHLLGKNLGLWEEKYIKIINDLIITRIVNPASKLESFEFISDYFGIKHSRRDFYRVLSELPKLKEEGKKLGYELNQELINKTTLLLGIKGYYTNLSEEKLSNEKVIEQYKNLWKVEQNFRISKSNLKARPSLANHLFEYEVTAIPQIAVG